MGVSGQSHAPAALLAGRKPGTRCTRSWVGTGAGWTDAENVVAAGI